MTNRRVNLGLIALAGIIALGQSAPPGKILVSNRLPANRVEIVPEMGKGTVFAPSKITCWASDQISWRNASAEPHEIGVINADGKFVPLFDGPLQPDSVSGVFSPALRYSQENKQSAYTLEYVCRLHKGERGTIVVNPVP